MHPLTAVSAGVFVSGLAILGCQWSPQTNTLTDLPPRPVVPGGRLPIVLLRAVPLK